MARRGGVKRISATIYEEVRMVLRSHLEKVRSFLTSQQPPNGALT